MNRSLLFTVLFCLAVGMLGPRNLRVSDEWYTRFRVAWDPAPSRVNGYKLIYQPEGTDMFLCGKSSEKIVCKLL